MDARELLKTWPGWANANAARVFASPAWRKAVKFGEETGSLVRAESVPGAAISLSVALDDVPHVLTFAPCPLFPELDLLKDRFAALPSEIILALVEKECGTFFQFLEETLHCSFAVRGISGEKGAGIAFKLETDATSLFFSLAPASGLELRFGTLDCLDCAHETIRTLAREAFVRHAVLTLSDEEAAQLKAGDYLLLENGLAPEWIVDVPMDETVQVLSPESGSLTFAQLADDDLPAVPETATYTLKRRGKVLGIAELAKVGQSPAFKLVCDSRKVNSEK